VIRIPTPPSHSASLTNSSSSSRAGFIELKRGSIPVVVVESWSHVTEPFLERKWEQFQKRGSRQPWDYSRVLLEHWEARILGQKRGPYPTEILRNLV
jgi:hypothetical protein